MPQYLYYLYYAYQAYTVYDSLEGGVGGKNWMKKYGLDTMNNRAGDKDKTRRRRGLEIEYSGTAEPRRLIYGRQVIAGMHTIPPYCSGDQGKFLHMVYTIAGHECYDITDVYFDKYQILDANIGAVTGSSNDGYVATGPFKTLTWIRRYLGTSTQTVDWILNNTYPSAFTSDFRGRGVCYVAIQMKWEKNVFATGQPDVTFDVKGKKVYDPRLDSTNGGSGSHRYTDSTTWEYSTNPALCTRDYLVNEVGFANDEIDDTLVAAAATVCDQQVEIPPGATYQNRYTTNITLYADDDWEENLQDLIDTMHGWVTWSDGKWRIYAGAWNSSSAPAITKQDWVGNISVRTSWDRAERWNAVRAFYIDPDRNWQTVECYPRRNPAYETADGGERIWREVDLPGCINEYEAQRHADLWLLKSRNQTTISGTLRPEFIQLSPSDTVLVTDDEFGWTAKSFRVVAMDVESSGSVAVTLIEEGATMWADLDVGDYDSPLGSTTIDPGATYPSAPLSLVASGDRGAIHFSWDPGSEDLRGQGYRLIEGSNSYDATLGLEVWRGSALQATIPTDTTTRWYWVQGEVGSYLSAYYPNTFGVAACASTPPGDGTPGTYAPGLSLQATAQQFRYSGSGTNIGVSTIGFDALLTALPGATAGFYANNYLADGTLINSLELAGTGNTNRGFHINSFTQGGSTAYATIVASVGGGYFDRMTVVRLQEGVQGGDGSPGSPGASAFNWVNVDSTVFETGPNYVISTLTGSDAFVPGPHSIESFRGGAFVSAIGSATNGVYREFFISLTDTPADGATWTSLKYALLARTSSYRAEVYENASQVWIGSSVDLTTERLGIVYDNTAVRYYVGNSVVYSHATSADQTLYLDTSVYGLNATAIKNIAFGPAGAAGAGVRIQGATAPYFTYVKPTTLFRALEFESPEDVAAWTGGVDTIEASTTQTYLGLQSMKLIHGTAGADSYVFIRGLTLPKPATLYRVSAWVYVDAFTASALGDRAILLWDGNNSNSVTLSQTTPGWVKRSVELKTHTSVSFFEIRLYCPQGTVYWDHVEIVEESPPDQQLDFYASHPNLLSSVTWSTTPTITTSGVGDYQSVNLDHFLAYDSVRLTAAVDGFSDWVDIRPVVSGAGLAGLNGLVGYLTNENHSVPSSSNGYVPSYDGATGEFQVWRGTTRVNVNSITFATGVSSPSGLTKAITSAGSYSVTGGLGVSDTLGMQVFQATAFGVTINKLFTLGKNPAGDEGVPGTPGGIGPPGSNILQNGDFTYVNSITGRLAGWDGGTTTAHSYSDTGGVDGSRCFVATSYDAARNYLNEDFIPVSPMDELLDVSIQMRSPNSGHWCYLAMACYDEQKQFIDPESEMSWGIFKVFSTWAANTNTLPIYKPKLNDPVWPGFANSYNHVLIPNPTDVTLAYNGWPNSSNWYYPPPRITDINTTASTSYDLLTLATTLPTTVTQGGQIGHGISGSTFRYWPAGNYTVTNSTWTKYTWRVGGQNAPWPRFLYSQNQGLENNTFRQKTAYVKFGMLVYPGGTEGDLYFDNYTVQRRAFTGGFLNHDPQMTMGGGAFIWNMIHSQVTSYDSTIRYCPASGFSGGGCIVMNVGSAFAGINLMGGGNW